MSDIIIQADKVGKKYTIRHQAQGGYRTLREVVSGKAKDLFQKRNSAAEKRQSKEDFWALKDVSFEIKRGEVVGVIGRNGAGKSTLLKILSRITEPTTGRVYLKGRVASLLEVGTGFHPELTGRENVFLNGAILGMSRAEIKRKFDEIVAFAEVEKFLDTPVKRYSSGMYVRLAFAVAAHLEPEILIVDEVLAVGDAEFQKKCLGKMQEVSKGGRTVLFVSHNMAAITNLCSRAIWLHRGIFQSTGTPGKLIELYLSQAITSSSNELSRPSWAKPLIFKVETLDQFSQPRSNFTLGESIAIELSYKANPTISLHFPVMGIIVNHATRGLVGGVNTRMTGYRPKFKSACGGKFRCILNDAPFLPGRYYVDVWLGNGSEDIDTISSACHFDIQESDIYGTGQRPFADMGVIYFKPYWQFTAENASQ